MSVVVRTDCSRGLTHHVQLRSLPPPVESTVPPAGPSGSERRKRGRSLPDASTRTSRADRHRVSLADSRPCHARDAEAGAVTVCGRGLLPSRSQTTLRDDPGPVPLVGKTGHGLVFHEVGVAGFEPTASSSRTGNCPPPNLPIFKNFLVKALVPVGCRRSLGDGSARSSPRLLPSVG